MLPICVPDHLAFKVVSPIGIDSKDVCSNEVPLHLMILAAESPVLLPVQGPVLEDALRNIERKALVVLFSDM